MFWIIVFIVASTIVVWRASRFAVKALPGDADHQVEVLIKWLVIAVVVIVIGLACLWACYLTTGFYRGVSEGQRYGYLTKLSKSGMVFKTNECEMQVGTGEMAALQSPWRFSIRDPEVLARANEAMGRRVHFEYVEWFMAPAHAIGTRYEITSIRILE